MRPRAGSSLALEPLLIEWDAVDKEFVHDYTEGFDADATDQAAADATPNAAMNAINQPNLIWPPGRSGH